MRGRWPVVAVMVAACALAGCTNDTTATPPAATKPAATEQAATKPATDPAQNFVDTVRARVPEVAEGRQDEEIEAIAGNACVDLAAGKTADEVVAAARTLGTLDAEATDQATARELVKLAIDTVCPNQSGRVDEF